MARLKRVKGFISFEFHDQYSIFMITTDIRRSYEYVHNLVNVGYCYCIPGAKCFRHFRRILVFTNGFNSTFLTFTWQLSRFLVIYEILKYLIYNRFVAKFVNMSAQNNISGTIDPILKIIWLIEISYTRP